MSTDRFDRQNRVYGVEGTQKLQNGSVFIHGPKTDLTYEVAKNLLLSGLNHLNLNLTSTTDTDSQSQSQDQTDSQSQTKFNIGQLHMTPTKEIITELNELNPYAKLVIFDSSLISIINILSSDVVFLLNPSRKELENYEKNTNAKIVCLQVKQTEKTYQFEFANNFRSHTITDTDGENYELLTIAELIAKPNSSDRFEIKTTANHNMSESNLIKLKLDGMNHWTEFRVGKVINNLKFEIVLDEEDDQTHYINFSNGYVQRQKEHMVLNHTNISHTLTYDSYSNIHELNPVVQYYYGALVSSEIIKALTSKYVGFNQTMSFEMNPTIANRPSGELSDKLANLKCFMVGSGAIGCELLKNLVALNVASKPGSYIKITDPDHIEVSNLSRQFLFRSENVGKSKSEVASDRVRVFKPETNIMPYQEKLSPDNQSFVNEHFTEVDLVFNALDNLNARLYVDSQCLKMTKPLFESGTLGTKGNTQPVIPHITESYGASQDQAQEQSFPACTLKNFPTLIQHTIHWAMDDFDGLFNKQPQVLKQYFETYLTTKDFKYLDNLPPNESNVVKNNLKRLIERLNMINNLTDYIKWACQLWAERFVNRIGRLLKNHPADSETDGKPFWSNGKKCPKIHNFNINDPTTFDYVYATTKLLIETYPKKNVDLEIIHFERIIYDFIETSEFSELFGQTYCDDPDMYDNDLNTYPHMTELNTVLDKVANKFNSNGLEFEKDLDTNNHIKYVQSTSNSRALNYSIPMASFYETKGIAGRIIPALATTTSIVSSLIVIEALKYLENPKRPVEDYASTFVNTADNFIIQSEPMPPTVSETNGMKFTEWGQMPSEGETEQKKMASNSSMTLEEFIQEWSTYFNNQINMVCHGSKMLYMEGDSNSEKRKSETLEKLLTDSDNRYLSIFVEDDNINLPEIYIS